MRIMRLLPIVLGLGVLAGCGSVGYQVDHITSDGKSLHYTLTDLGVLTASSGSTSKASAQSYRASVNRSQSRAASRAGAFLPHTRADTLTDLGSVLTNTHEVTINNAGQVVFTVGNEGPAQIHAQAVLYQAGNTTALGTLGGPLSYCYAINASGQAVGVSSLPDNGSYHACLYEQGKATDLGTLGGGASIAYALNNTGQIVGLSYTQTAGADPSAGTILSSTPHLFLYQTGVMRDLGTIDGTQPVPYAINDSGQIVGVAYSTTASSIVAFTVNQGVTSALPTLGGDFSGAYGINNSGLIVGSSTRGSTNSADYQQHAVTWQNGHITDIGTLPNGNHALALGVNNQGDIVGGSTAEANSAYDHGFVRPHNGVMQDLNALIPANSGWMLLAAQSINDQGQIVGLGRINNEFHAYLLTPTSTSAGQ